MQKRTIEEEYIDYLNKLPIQTLRVLGRQQGVPSKSLATKPLIIQSLLDLLMGRAQPTPSSGRGAPVKENYLDPAILQRLINIRRSFETEEAPRSEFLEVNSPEAKKFVSAKSVETGLLDILSNGCGFLRVKFGRSNQEEDIYLSAPLIQALGLRQGDFVACHVSNAREPRTVESVVSVNEQLMGDYESRPSFEKLTPDYPREKIELSRNGVVSMRMIDLFAPIGKGQRALVVAPPQTGSSTLLKEIAQAVQGSKSSNFKLIVLLIDERPEEVTEFRRAVLDADLIYTTFEESAEEHVRAAQLAIEHAKRYCERKRDVVLLCDSVTKLARAFQRISKDSANCVSGGIGVKQFLAAARNTIEAGSLTIVATASVNAGKCSEVCDEIRETCNAEIVLSAELAQKAVFPAIDLIASGTRKSEWLLSQEESSAVRKMRSEGLTTQELIKRMKSAKSNQALVAQTNAKK